MINIEEAAKKYIQAKKILAELQGRTINEEETRNDFMAGINTNKNLFSETVNVEYSPRKRNRDDYKQLTINDIICNVREAIDRSKLSYKDMAERLDMTKVGFYVMVKEDTQDSKKFPLNRLFQIANILNISLLDLMKKNPRSQPGIPVMDIVPKKNKTKKEDKAPIVQAPAKKKSNPKAVPVVQPIKSAKKVTATKKKRSK